MTTLFTHWGLNGRALILAAGCVLLCSGCTRSHPDWNYDSSRDSWSGKNPPWLEQLLEEERKSPQTPAKVFPDEAKQNQGLPPLTKPAIQEKGESSLSALEDRLAGSAAELPVPARRVIPDEKGSAQSSGIFETRDHAVNPVNVVVNNSIATDLVLDNKKVEQTSGGPSRLERLYASGTALLDGRVVEQVGYNQLRLIRQPPPEPSELFPKVAREEDDSILPLGGPIDSAYRIGPGDRIQLQATGGVEIDDVFTVDRNGRIFIPEVGAVTLSGITARDLNAILSESLDEQFRNTIVEASILTSQGIRVLLAGAVKKPGLRILPPDTTMINLLSLAGGPTKEGSLRRVTLRRSGTERTYDLYDWIFPSDKIPYDEPLIAGDVITVPPIGKTAAIAGTVREGIYEFVPGESLADLAFWAGIESGFEARTALLERKHSESGRTLVVLSSRGKSMQQSLREGDVLEVQQERNRLDESVVLSGQVVRPGIYPFVEGMRVAEAAIHGQGFLLEAYLDRAMIVRTLGNEKGYDLLKGDGRARTRTELVWVNLREALAGNESENIPLQRLDRLIVSPRSFFFEKPVVILEGAVRRPGEYDLAGNMTLSSLLGLAGGAAENAHLGEGRIVRRIRRANDAQFDVQVIPFNLQSVLSGEQDYKLENKDRITVRKSQSLQVSATIQGHVAFPGTYTLPQGARISDLLVAAGGLLEHADLRAAILTRERIRNRQIEELRELTARSGELFARTRDLVTRGGTVGESLSNQLGLEGLKRLDRNARLFDAEGRIVIDFLDPEFKNQTSNLLLENQDRLEVPQRSNAVVVLGRVFSPGTHVWREGLRVKDYIERVGGLKDDAAKKQVYVVTANGEVRSAAQRGRKTLFAMELGPGDAILVPSKPPGTSTQRQLLDSISVLQALAGVAATGAAAANNPTGSVDIQSAGVSRSTVATGSYGDVLESERRANQESEP